MQPSHPGTPSPKPGRRPIRLPRRPAASSYTPTHPDLLRLPRAQEELPLPELKPGDRVVGRYRIRESLEHIGDSPTFVAVDERTLADVRLQVAGADRHRITRITRFLLRAQRLKRLDHPGVARLLDFGADQGLYYCVEEWLPGRTLDELLSWGPLPLLHALSLGRQIAGGLAAAHDMNLAHGALNPSRVLVVGSVVAKITSFALLKRALLAPPGPGVAQFVTAPGYTSPERVAGLEVEAAAEDAWALGALMFEMLTGRRPAEPSRPTAVPPIMEAAPDTPRRLASIIDKLLARRVGERSLNLEAVGASLLALESELHGMA